MRRPITFAMVALATAIGSGMRLPAAAAERTGPAHDRSGRGAVPQAWAYLAWWLPDSWRSTQFARLDRILFFDLSVDDTGAIADDRGWPHHWDELRRTVTENGKALELTLSVLDEDSFRRLFASPASTARLKLTALALASDPVVSGIHLDFEVYGPMSAETVARFRGFVVELGNLLQTGTPPKTLTVFMPMGGEMQLYDKPSLRAASQVVVQGYDAHWTGSPTAGPIAPLTGASAITWEKAMALALSLGVRRNRILLSYPLFGYEWPTAGPDPRAATRGPAIRTTLSAVAEQYLPQIRISVEERMRTVAPFRDDASGSMYYRFENESGWHTGWFEGAWSLQRKADFIATHGLAGAAFFVLGYDGGSLTDSYLTRRAGGGASESASRTATQP